MKKKIVLISILVLNVVIIGIIIYQNYCINQKFDEINEKIEKLSASNSQQNLQISQLTEKTRELEYQDSLQNSETDESIFENTSIDGLNPISEEEAKTIWETYLTNELCEDVNKYNFDNVEILMVKPTNLFTAGTAPIKVADFERSAYVFKYIQKDKMGEIIGYVDIYTGKVIGGYYNGD